jgi:hypothetical protein
MSGLPVKGKVGLCRMTTFIQEPQHRIYLRVVSGELPISAEFREFSVSGLGCADRRSCGPFRRFITTVTRFIGPCAIRFRSCRPVRQATGSSFPSEGEASCHLEVDLPRRWVEGLRMPGHRG